MTTTTSKAKAAAIGAIGNFASIVAIALGDGAVSTEDIGSMVASGIIGLVTVFAVWQTRNREIPTTEGQTAS